MQQLHTYRVGLIVTFRVTSLIENCDPSTPQPLTFKCLLFGQCLSALECL